MRRKRDSENYMIDPPPHPWFLQLAFKMAEKDRRNRNQIFHERELRERNRDQQHYPDPPDNAEVYVTSVMGSDKPAVVTENDRYVTWSDDVTVSSVVSERVVHSTNWLYWMNPVVLAILVCGVILYLLILLLRRAMKTKSPLGSQEIAAPSILVYPAQNGQPAHFLTKEINFSLPSPRSNSLTELSGLENGMGVSEADSEDCLTPSRTHQRSNSFSVSDLGVIDPSLYQENFLDDDLLWPEGHVGRLWFSLRYESNTEKLLVNLVKAKNLPSRTVASVNTCDPYVRLQLLPDERRTLHSKQKKKTCNPFFEETFVFQVSSKGLEELVLKMTVVDGGRARGRQLLGHVLFPLAALPIDGVPPQEPHLYKLDLEKDPHEPTSDLGEMLVSLLYNENLHRITVTVIEGRRLKIKGERKSIYVRITMNQQYRAVKSKRSGTTMASSDGGASISECFHFRLPTASLPHACITLHVLQAGAKCARDKVIGKFVLGSFMFARGKALEHWSASIANPMEQVQQWHILSI